MGWNESVGRNRTLQKGWREEKEEREGEGREEKIASEGLL
jgi:hypothetical protein